METTARGNFPTQDGVQAAMPDAGQRVTIPVIPGCTVGFAFDPAHADAERVGDDLLFTLDNGGAVTLQNFFVADEHGGLPNLRLPDGTITGSLDFFADSGMDLSTAAGPTASASAESSGMREYADDPGALVDGVDRLGSLGTDFWNRNTAAPGAPVPAEALAALGGGGGGKWPPHRRKPPRPAETSPRPAGRRRHGGVTTRGASCIAGTAR
jgi:hypothetical protein